MSSFQQVLADAGESFEESRHANHSTLPSVETMNLSEQCRYFDMPPCDIVSVTNLPLSVLLNVFAPAIWPLSFLGINVGSSGRYRRIRTLANLQGEP